MGRRTKVRHLDIWMNGEPVGRWTRTAQGQHEFRYAEAWLRSPAARTLSLSMPMQDPRVPYKGERVEAYFDNLLPDSPAIRQRVRSRFGAASTAAFDLLAEIGRDCVGAIQLMPADVPARDVRRIHADPLGEPDVAALLRATVSPAVLGQRDGEAFRISLAGAQEKTALLWHEGRWHLPRGTTPTTHIMKLPLGRVGGVQADMSTSIENEWLCAQIVRAFGLPVARCEIARFEDQKALVVERFDRRRSPSGGWWLRLPQEDMCQATATPMDLKYESAGGPGIREIMRLLLGAREAAADRACFFKTQVLFWMLAAIDGHAKNFSVFLEPRDRFSLTPLYDVLSAYPILGHNANQLPPEKITLAMAARGNNTHYRWAKILPRHWLSTAERCDFNGAEEILAELAEATPAVIGRVRQTLPGGFPAEVSEPILAGLEHAAERLSAG
jgi:serine/threonine-protein kinase HipA